MTSRLKLKSSCFVLGLLLLAVACGGSSGTKGDAACSGGSACGQPCDEGNNLGVGRYCTKGAGQCDKNEGLGSGLFIFCTIDEDPTAPDAFCTGPCSTDSQCGENAYCDGQGGQSGCVPASCGGTPMDAGV
jgi:hypothetical protein